MMEFGRSKPIIFNFSENLENLYINSNEDELVVLVSIENPLLQSIEENWISPRRVCIMNFLNTDTVIRSRGDA